MGAGPRVRISCSLSSSLVMALNTNSLLGSWSPAGVSVLRRCLDLGVEGGW